MKQRKARAVMGILAGAALAAAAPLAARAQGDTGAGTSAAGSTDDRTGGANATPRGTDQGATGGASDSGATGGMSGTGSAGGSAGSTNDMGASGTMGADQSQTGGRVYNDSDPAAVNTQSGSAKGLSDRQINVRVREAIIENQAVGSSFRSVKVHTKKGKVTLKGRVRTQAEKDEAAAKASAIVGSDNVNNEITVSQ